MLKPWEELESYIVNCLKDLDKYCKRTPGSGNKGRKGDIFTSCGLHIECKQRMTKSVTINSEVWQKLNQEIPLHSNKIPVLALENKDRKRWAVLDLDDFLFLYKELWRIKNETTI